MSSDHDNPPDDGGTTSRWDGGRAGWRRQVMEKVRAAAPPKKPGEPTAARSQDFLYGDDGLPE